MPSKFPAKVYVVIEDEGTEDEWLDAKKSANDHVEFGEHKRVAEYGLLQVYDATATAKLTRAAN